jgi:EmrB/QacA subfamily drug resistance transporter
VTTATAHVPQTFTPEERKVTLAAIVIVFLLAALDQTIVSTAMPTIAAQLNGLNLYTWVTTSYLLSSTVMVPIYGKLNDIYGRKPVLVAGVCLFAFGSWLCGLSGEFGRLPLLGGAMTQLIVFRAVQGLGGGALFTSAFAIVADLFPPRERGKFSGALGSIFGLASLLGPLIGGFFTDLGPTRIGGVMIEGWRWIFYTNLPLSLLALFMILVKMPPLLHRHPGKIDFLGAGLIVLTFVPLLLALTWGGRDYPWDSSRILHLLGLAAVGLVLFLIVESRVSNPILSLGMFRQRVFATCNLAAFTLSMSFLGTVTFLPLFLQLGQGRAATASGLAMLPLMIGLILTAGVAGRLVTRTGRYKPFMLGGAVCLLLGVFLISRITPETSSLDLAWRLFIMGVGLGPLQSLFSLAVQNAAEPHQMGVATSASQFFRQIGSTVGVAVFGAVLSHNLAVGAAALPRAPGAPPPVNLTINELETMAVAAMPNAPGGHAIPKLDAAAQGLISTSITGVFNAALIVLAVGFLFVLMIPELPLRQRHAAPEVPAEPEDQPAVVEAESEAAAKTGPKKGAGRASKAGRAKR